MLYEREVNLLMIIVMSPSASEENLERVQQKLTQMGLRAHLSKGEDRTIVGVIGVNDGDAHTL